MLIQIYPGINVVPGAPLNLEDITALSEGLRMEAQKERIKTIEQSKEEEINKFYQRISEMYRAKNFYVLLQEVAFTKIDLTGNLKELIKEYVLPVRFGSPLCDAKEAQLIIAAMKKIGVSMKDDSWKEKIQVRIVKTNEMNVLMEVLKDQWDNKKLEDAIVDWESRQGLSTETLMARYALGISLEVERFLKYGDRELSKDQFLHAAGIYRALQELGVDIGKRKEVVSAADKAYDQSDQSNRIEKAAIKAGLRPDLKDWWKFW